MTNNNSLEANSKKYTLIEPIFDIRGHWRCRVKALKDFGNIEAGTIGGWVHSEANLSQQGRAWIAGEARVYDRATVAGRALVCGNAVVCCDATVSENAVVTDNAVLAGNVRVYGHAMVSGNTYIDGDAVIRDNAKVFAGARVMGDAVVRGNAIVRGDAIVRGKARVYGEALVCGDVHLEGDADIPNSNSYFFVSGIGEHWQPITFFNTPDGVRVNCAFIYDGTIACFRRKLESDDRFRYAERKQEYELAIELGVLWVEGSKEAE